MSTIRYFPASGTAGFERLWVRGKRREPCPPPIMMARTLFIDLRGRGLAMGFYFKTKRLKRAQIS
jgi:hypothetical protein